MAKRGEDPCKELKLGNAYRVVTAGLQRLVAIKDTPGESVPTALPLDRGKVAGFVEAQTSR
ncbi:hypothetical protein ACH489_08660 [Streptomyces rubiginosohelvolus]|uniref:hypothetical protein n=1 Tax=Streptomyces rubiginosohelvolus TaxID=67362 RepID=UPI0037A4F02E